MIRAKWGTRTSRREERRQVRNALGISRDEAPNIHNAVYAAKFLDRIVQAASDGRFRLDVVDQERGEVLDFSKALARMREEGYER
jgi:hypothetical protein